MLFTIEKMNQHYAVDVLCWKYPAPYDFYNNILTPDAIIELLCNKYYVILDERQELIGFFCTGRSAQVAAGDLFGAYDEACVDIGLGMKPELTGKGRGNDFFSHILSFVKENHPGKDIRLTVATFNKRAIHLYEKAGFMKQGEFSSDDADFIILKKESELNSSG